MWAGDVKTLAELIECHDTCHSTPIGDDIPHHHTRFDTDLTEWVW